MSKIALSPNASGTGTFTLAAPNSNTDRTLTLPDNTGTVITTASTGGVSQTMLASGVAGNGPAFSAYMGSSQAPANFTDTKLQYNTESYDTADCYNTSLYRFTPNVAGYYLITARASFPSNINTQGSLSIWKNGSETARVWQFGPTTVGMSIGGNAIIYLNGSSDYVEIYSYIDSTNARTIAAGQTISYFQGCLVRAA